ncbi:MAG: hypothetical protein QM490_03460 [Candidatus Gracilibacteria bacterium]
MGAKDSYRKYKLITQVESSNSDEQSENDVNSSLKEADDILKSVRKSGNTKLLEKFEKENEELRKSIIESLKKDNKITLDELTKIKLELFDVIRLAEKNDIIETTSWFSKLTNNFTGADNKTIKEKSNDIFTKILSTFSKDEAVGALEYLNDKYSNFEEASRLGKAYEVIVGNNSIDELDNKYEVNVFQETLIKKILGKSSFEKGYNNEFLRGFNGDEKGNYLISISDFESEANGKDIFNINSMALTNYLKYLKNNNLLNKNKLLKIFGKNILIQLGKIWKTEDSNKENQIAKKELINIGLSEIVDDIIKYSELFQSKTPEDFTKKTLDFSNEDTKKAELYIQQNKDLRTKFLKQWEPRIKQGQCPNSIQGTEILKNTLKIEQQEKLKEKKSKLINQIKERFNGDEDIAIIFFNKLKGHFDNNPCSLGAIDIIDNFNAKEIIKYNKSHPKRKIVLLDDTEIMGFTQGVINIRSFEIDSQIQSIQLSDFSGLSIKEIQEKTTKLKLLEQNKIDIEKAYISATNFSKKDIKTYRKYKKEGKTNQEIMTFLRKDNQNLDKALTAHETKYKDYYNENKELEKTISNNLTLQENDYIPTNNGYKITIPSGENITISEEEKKLTLGNPEATENLINFYSTLNKVGLSNLWEYRVAISNSIGSISGSNVNYNDNLLGENEIKIFLNSILKSVGKKEININNTLEEFIELFKTENGYQAIGDGYKNNSNIKGSSKIEELFTKRYLLGPNGFEINKFKKEIQKKN